MSNHRSFISIFVQSRFYKLAPNQPVELVVLNYLNEYAQAPTLHLTAQHLHKFLGKESCIFRIMLITLRQSKPIK